MRRWEELLRNRSRRAILASVVVLLLALIGLSVLAAFMLRHVAHALASGEREALEQCARSAAGDIWYRITQDEGEIVQYLDLESEEAFTHSLSIAELAFPDIRLFAFLDDGVFLYAPESAERLTQTVLTHRADWLDLLSDNGRARMYLHPGGSDMPLTLLGLRFAERRGVLGIAWSLGRIREWAAQGTEHLRDAYAVCMSDATGRPLYSTGTERSAPGASSAERMPAATAALPDEAFPWRVSVRPRDTGRVDRFVRGQVLLLAALLGLLCLVAGASVWVLVRVTLKEMELARLKAEFAANVSHELRTPLALIRASGEALGGECDLDARRRARYLDILQRESRRLTELVGTVLSFARLRQDRERGSFRRTDLCTWLPEAIGSWKERPDRQDVHVETDLAEGPLAVELDGDAMQIALSNLLDNAVKFSPGASRIDVSLHRDDRSAALCVRDYGVGIDPGERERIFESFRRGEGDAVRRTRGTGIGLALVREIVELHGGEVEVAAAPDRGAAFTVRLPLSPEPPASGAGEHSGD